MTMVLTLAAMAAARCCYANDLEGYMRLQGPKPTQTYHYGPDAGQIAEYFRPRGDGPFPVVVLIHGGCWLARFEGLRQLGALAGALAHEGIAVWNVGYRGIDEAGGGFPCTYQDIAASLAELDRQAGNLSLDLHRVIAVGHSAGAHLALWAAARGNIPAASPLHTDAQPEIRDVIALGALADLRGDATVIEQSCGVNAASLTGVASASRPDVYADTSPAQMLPFHATLVFVNGTDDEIAPPELAARFAATARSSGMDASAVTIPDAGHFDEVTPSGPAWTTINRIILHAVGTSAERQ